MTDLLVALEDALKVHRHAEVRLGPLEEDGSLGLELVIGSAKVYGAADSLYVLPEAIDAMVDAWTSDPET